MTLDVKESAIRAVFSKLEEVDKVKRILEEAEAESREKKVIVTRKVKRLRKLRNKLRIMLRYGLHWSKPFYPFRLARNILLSRMYRLLGIKKYVLRGCEFDITFKCNFNCCHCSIARLDESPGRKELEVEEYERIVKEAMNLGATSFGLEGGEPFVSKNWENIIKVCRPRYNHILITSNGYLFDEEKAKKCKELGVDTINFSLDNGIPELHDLFRRKKGSFERVMNAVRLCKKYKIKVIINTVVGKFNLYTEGFRKVLEFGEKEKLLVHILFAKAIGNFKNDDSMLEEEDFKAYEKIVEPYSYAFVHHETKITYGSGGCNGTKEMLQFTPYGDVMNCANMHIYFGNAREESIAVIRERALGKTPFGKYRPCFLTLDRDFMEIYYSLMERKPHINIDEFREALKEYERTWHKVVYPELHKEEVKN